MLIKKKFLVFHLLIITTLACVTNTSISQVPTPRPTRTPIPTFTITPLPPTATPVPTATTAPLSGVDTATPIPEAHAVEAAVAATPAPTETPLPTETPAPPTNTPPPTQPPPPPPTATPVPPPTAAPIANSPLPTPTHTPEPGTPPGRYEELKIDGENDCANIGVFGWVKDKGNDNPVQYVTIEVTGDDDDDDFEGPFIGKTGADGKYSIFIGPVDDVGHQKFKARVIGGPGVLSEDTVEWETSDDCHDDGDIQRMEINWAQKSN